MNVHKTKFEKKTVLWGTITLSEIGKQNLHVQAKNVFFEKGCRKSAFDNPERYCGWFWIHCSSKKFERMAREAMEICLRVLKKSNKSRFDSYSRHQVTSKMVSRFAAVTNKEISQIIKRAVPEIHEEDDKIRFEIFYSWLQCCVYTRIFIHDSTVIISIDNQDSTKRLPSSTVFYLEYPAGIEAHDLKLMVAWKFLL